MTETTFYAASLLVWSHADPARAAAIRETLEEGSKAKAAAIHRAVKAAGAGKKLGARLSKAMNSPLGAVIDEKRIWGHGTLSDTEAETDGFGESIS